MERRSFLLNTSALALSQLMLGCSNNNQGTLNVQLLKGSIPGQVVSQFSRGLKAQLKFAPVEQLQDLFEKLKEWQKKTNTQEAEWRISVPFMTSNQKSATSDLVTMGDFWLTQAIQEKLIKPLEESKIKQWSALPKRWQNLVTRNDKGQIDPKGKVWAIPYRWGTTVIVYRRDKFQELGWTPSDWSDLWRNELLGRISVLEQPREAIGLVLKKLGQSYNLENLDKVPNLEKELVSLDRQVKFYSSTKYLEPLIVGDTWLAVGWSNDVVQTLGRYPQLSVVVPKSGTAIWADLWVSPAGKENEDLLYNWLDFCLTPQIAQEISLLTKTNSPAIANLPKSDIQESLRKLLQMNVEVFDKSDFLLPLSPTATARYQSLFASIQG
ncbi:polyamine ABC transporter substrate-binding protein [Scytonema hofmannii PCC 7110]|uniref:Polyamine ABC transporter substrate-binding protein n=1 Tax=Scytonema hofmannii PCC 7110 TaxID=128403 RepID=A0A139X0K2_9CYAN|nr:extracellular solute-binding protein [Scytonema hofmannii]KYC38224.1 polyamine ABC transporter substrate-binding protein [Scytonema hofmannii PCC 7110]